MTVSKNSQQYVRMNMRTHKRALLVLSECHSERDQINDFGQISSFGISLQLATEATEFFNSLLVVACFDYVFKSLYDVNSNRCICHFSGSEGFKTLTQGTNRYLVICVQKLLSFVKARQISTSLHFRLWSLIALMTISSLEMVTRPCFASGLFIDLAQGAEGAPLAGEVSAPSAINLGVQAPAHTPSVPVGNTGTTLPTGRGV